MKFSFPKPCMNDFFMDYSLSKKREKLKREEEESALDWNKRISLTEAKMYELIRSFLTDQELNFPEYLRNEAVKLKSKSDDLYKRMFRKKDGTGYPLEYLDLFCRYLTQNDDTSLFEYFNINSTKELKKFVHPENLNFFDKIKSHEDILNLYQKRDLVPEYIQQKIKSINIDHFEKPILGFQKKEKKTETSQDESKEEKKSSNWWIFIQSIFQQKNVTINNFHSSNIEKGNHFIENNTQIKRGNSKRSTLDKEKNIKGVYLILSVIVIGVFVIFGYSFLKNKSVRDCSSLMVNTKEQAINKKEFRVIILPFIEGLDKLILAEKPECILYNRLNGLTDSLGVSDDIEFLIIDPSIYKIRKGNLNDSLKTKIIEDYNADYLIWGDYTRSELNKTMQAGITSNGYLKKRNNLENQDSLIIDNGIRPRMIFFPEVYTENIISESISTPFHNIDLSQHRVNNIFSKKIEYHLQYILYGMYFRNKEYAKAFEVVKGIHTLSSYSLINDLGILDSNIFDKKNIYFEKCLNLHKDAKMRANLFSFLVSSYYIKSLKDTVNREELMQKSFIYGDSLFSYNSQGLPLDNYEFILIFFSRIRNQIDKNNLKKAIELLNVYHRKYSKYFSNSSTRYEYFSLIEELQMKGCFLETKKHYIKMLQEYNEVDSIVLSIYPQALSQWSENFKNGNNRYNFLFINKLIGSRFIIIREIFQEYAEIRKLLQTPLHRNIFVGCLDLKNETLETLISQDSFSINFFGRVIDFKKNENMEQILGYILINREKIDDFLRKKETTIQEYLIEKDMNLNEYLNELVVKGEKDPIIKDVFKHEGLTGFF